MKPLYRSLLWTGFVAAGLAGGGAPASVQLESITHTVCGAGNVCNEVPVVLTNVSGQIQIHLNIDPGSKNVSTVQALIGDNVVAAQGFASSVAQASVAKASVA